MPDELTDGLATGEDTGLEGTQQTVEGTEPPVGDEAPPREYVEVDDPDNRYVRIKVNGEDVEVPFSEAIRGYSREADYTRKQQALAQERDELGYWAQVAQAMRVDPQATLALLARQHNLTIGQAQQLQAQHDQPPQFDDPLEKQVWEQQQEIKRLRETYEQDAADRQLNQAIAALQQNGASDEDVRAVVQVAYQNGLGIEQFPMIYQSVAFQRLQERARASAADQQRRQAQTQQRQQAASSANQLVTAGTGAPGNGITNQRPADGTMSLRDAAEAALEALGEPVGFDGG